MKFKGLEDVTFVAADADEMEIQILATVEKFLGRRLARADPLRLFLLSVETLLVQQRLLFDQMAKMNLLAYAKGNFLDHIGILVGTYRLPASAATVTLSLTLSAAREKTVVIPKGTRITAGDNVYFALDDDAVISPGTLSITAQATCTETGGRGNGYLPGEIKNIVDPVPYLAEAKNTTKSEGGAETEEDESFRERIHEAPEHFSTAGPSGAYAYHAKTASALIVDVGVESPAPGEVVVYPLLQGGTLPSEEILALVTKHLGGRTVRPLTDKVRVKSPEVVEYDVEVTYYVNREEATEAAAIHTRAEQAIQDFVLWQKTKLGRDINPTEIYYRLRAAGVKRAEVTSPAFKVTKNNQVAIAKTIKVSFGGLEDE